MAKQCKRNNGYVKGSIDDPIHINATIAFDYYYNYIEKRSMGNIKRPKRNCYQANRYWRRFIEIGKICYDHNISVVTYLDIILSKLNGSYASITPKRISESFNLYQDYIKTHNIDSAYYDKYKAYLIRLADISAAKSLSARDILYSALSDFPAWFRIFSVDELDSDLYDMWARQAYKEYYGNIDLQKFLKERKDSRLNELIDLGWLTNYV